MNGGVSRFRGNPLLFGATHPKNMVDITQSFLFSPEAVGHGMVQLVRALLHRQDLHLLPSAGQGADRWVHVTHIPRN